MHRNRPQDLGPLLLIDNVVCTFLLENLNQSKSRVHSYLGDQIAIMVQKTKVHSLKLDGLNELQAYYGWLNEAKIGDQELLDFFGLVKKSAIVLDSGLHSTPYLYPARSKC